MIQVVKSNKVYHLRKGLLVIVAVVLSITLVIPGFSYGEEYDPTEPRDYNVEQDSVTTEQPSNNEEINGNTTLDLVQESTSESAIDVVPETTTETTVVTTTESRLLLPTKAQNNPAFNGKNATRIPIITYHRVVSAKEKKDKKIKKNSLFISVSVFNKQMKWLHKHKYRTISTQEFYDWYTGKIKLPKKSVLITFDDGSYSVMKYALPILKKYNMKATFFVIGKNIGADTNKASSRGSYHSAGLDVINQTIQAYPNFEFQSHTYNMHHMINGRAALHVSSFEEQKKDFTAMYNKYGFTFMAYPYGRYSQTSIDAAKASNVKMAFTYGKNAFATKKQNRYAIARIKINANHSMKKFYKWFK